MTKRKTRNRADWLQVRRAFLESGLPLEGFCAANGINYRAAREAFSRYRWSRAFHYSKPISLEPARAA